MTTPGEQHEQGDELDLDAETVQDLEPDDETAEQVIGGSTPNDRSRLCCAPH
jgi:hypothetical protein